MKQIVKQAVPLQINVENVLSQKRGFIIQVYEGRVGILIGELNKLDGRTAGFFEFSANNYNTVSINKEEVIERTFEHEEIDLFYFDSLQDFACEVIKNGWKIDSE